MDYEQIKKRAHKINPGDPRLAPIDAYPKCSKGDYPKSRLTMKRIKETRQVLKGRVALYKNGTIDTRKLNQFWGK